MKKSEWAKRIQRGDDLAELYPSAAEVLTFYRHILEFQKTTYDAVSLQLPSGFDHGRPFRDQLNIDAAARRLPDLLLLVRKTGPSRLGLEAEAISRAGSEHQRELVGNFAHEMESETELRAFFPRVLLQPYAEYFAAGTAARLEGFGGSVCPVCKAGPQVAVLRPEGDGGKRFLLCSFCFTEWEFRRILCPVCGEEDHAKLPRYSAAEIRAVRVEACDTCKHYLKSVDMTADGLAVPLVDEVASASLDVWAVKHGYRKISPNIVGF